MTYYLVQKPDEGILIFINLKSAKMRVAINIDCPRHWRYESRKYKCTCKQSSYTITKVVETTVMKGRNSNV